MKNICNDEPFLPPDKRQWPLRDGDDELLRRLDTVLMSSATGVDRKHSPDDVSRAVRSVRVDGLRQTISALTAFPSRHTLSRHNVAAGRWIHDAFADAGYEQDVHFHEFTYRNVVRQNVICTKRGTHTPERFVVMCAHYDSRASDLSDVDALAPGADDNASGIAVLIEAATILKDRDTDASIQFIAFSGEEQGYVGAQAYVTFARRADIDIRLVINLDMVGHASSTGHPSVIVERDVGNATTANDTTSERYALEVAALARSHTGLSITFGKIYSSDYMPFEKDGFVCIGVYDGADAHPFYHTADDTVDRVNFEQCADVTRMLVAAALELQVS